MKKRFTLIELLAVIIIITVISMIGSNMVLGIIDKAKEQSFARSVESAMNAFDFVRQYNESGITTIEIKSSDLKLEHNRFIGGDIVLDDNGNAKVLYATDGNYCASGLLGSLVVEKGNCNQDLVSPTVTIEATSSLDKSTLTIKLNATDSGSGLDPKAYSFDNGVTWQTSNEISVSSSYKDIIKVRDIVNNITTIDYNISKLTINANGGVIAGLEELSIYWLEDGETKNIPTPIKVGYSFTDWAKVGDSSISGNSFTMGTEETSLTANYVNATFILEVKPNGGTWDTYTTTQLYSKIYGSTTTINNPTRTGYTFNGWTVSGTNSSIDGTTFTMGSANASLTATWIVNNYTLTVNANGGSWSGTTPQTKAFGSTTTINNPTRTGFTFNNWTVSGTGSSISGTTFTMGSANASLTANWTPINYILTVRSARGGTIAVENLSLGVSVVVGSETTNYLTVRQGDTLRVSTGPASNFSLVYIKYGSTVIPTGGTFSYDLNTNNVTAAWKRNTLFLFNLDSSETYPFSLTGLCDGWCSQDSGYDSTRHFVYFRSPSNAIRLDIATNSPIDLTDFSQVCSWLYTAQYQNDISSGSIGIGIIPNRSSWVNNYLVAAVSLPRDTSQPTFCGNISNFNGSYYVGMQLLEYSNSTTHMIINYVHYIYLEGETYQ